MSWRHLENEKLDYFIFVLIVFQVLYQLMTAKAEPFTQGVYHILLFSSL